MFSWLRRPAAPPAAVKSPGFFSTDNDLRVSRADLLQKAIASTFQRTAADIKVVGSNGETVAMDAADQVAMDSSLQTIKLLNGGLGQSLPDAQLGWYASQGFIGYQTAAMIAQNWLVDKACTMPARDAARNGYDITVNDGSEVAPETLDEMVKLDKKYGIPNHLVQFVRMGRIFGIRIAMFLVDSNDPDYYELPFNPDGIIKNSYRGITQIDPYWITPELDQSAAINPASEHFYEPTWWRINGKRIHRTHLVIMRNGIVPDILKPSYLYGGIPVPQKLYERVYAAERTANEAPMLTMTKRLTVMNLDVSQAITDPAGFAERMNVWTSLMNNYGVKVIGGDEKIEQFDTALADVDAVIMTQYQIVAAAAEVPATKLLGTTPKGFNATGEYEEASYHEYLESIQQHEMSELLNRHHLMIIRSDLGMKFSTEVNWRPVDSPTAEEAADINLKKSQADTAWSQTGAIDGIDIRARLINDKDSGYNGMAEEVPGLNDEETDDDPDA